MTEKMLTLTQAFRTVLRALYPSRPALADEVEGADYFYPPFDGSIRPIEEVQAARVACDVLKDAIANQSVRLHGRLNGERPDDINPTEITRAGILIFDNVLDVWQPSTRVSQFRQLPNYLNVHCYAADIEALIGRHSNSALTSLEAAERGVRACYPDGVPRDVVNAVLCRNVGDWVKVNLPNMPTISDSTIKRAAGRKK
jgi:hypothetical protein